MRHGRYVIGVINLNTIRVIHYCMKITDMSVDSFEEEHFIKPIKDIPKITFLGFVSKYNVPSHPVFSIEDTSNVSQVVSELETLCDSCDLDSGGLQAYFVSSTQSEFSMSDVVIVCKVENWWNSCIPNDVTDIQSYISKQEDKMSNKLASDIPLTTVSRDMHKDCLLEGGSQIEEGYGQYQFIARLD